MRRPAGARTLRPSRGPGTTLRRTAPSALVALGAAIAVLAAGAGRGATPSAARFPAVEWQGLVGAARPRVIVGQRQIVVLKAPSLADRVAAAGGRATDVEERRWTTAALSEQKLLISKLGVQGIQITPEHSFTRVLNGFSAAIDARGLGLLERAPEVAGVYPVRAAYPAAISAPVLDAVASRPGARLALPGFDGRGVTIALLDTWVDRAHPSLRGRLLEGIDILLEEERARVGVSAPDPSEPERHGTEMAGLLVGDGGPAGFSGVASGASVLPIRVAGRQPDARGGVSLYARTDQLIAGLERAVDPNDDGDAHDAARVALVALAEPYAAFSAGPAARAAAGALRLDTLVVAPAGNDGAGGPAYGVVSGPGGAPAALTVGALDRGRRAESVRVVVRSGLDTLLSETLPLAGAIAPAQPVVAEVAALGLSTRASGQAPLRLADFFDGRGYSRVAGRAALVPASDSPGVAVRAAARAGAVAVLLVGRRLPPGALGLDDDAAVPVVALPSATGVALLASLRRGADVGVSIGRGRAASDAVTSGVAAFSSAGLAFDGRVKPDVVADGVGLPTSEPGRGADGSPRYGTVNGTSAAAATVAGAAAVLAQARPSLDGPALKSLLVSGARPLAGSSVTLQGAGAVDLGASAAAELAAAPTTLALGRASRAGWSSIQTITLRNLSPRPLRLVLHVERRSEGAAAVRFRFPRRLTVAAGERLPVRLVARVSSAPRGRALAEGSVVVRPTGGQALRLPWAITFGPPRGALLGPVELRPTEFEPSDTAPALLTFRAGRLVRSAARSELRPLDHLDVELLNPRGERLGVLARVRDLLPGRYAFGLTGRDPEGERLPPGVYRLRLVAYPTGRGAPASTLVRFRIRE